MSKHDLATNLISLFVVFVNDALETSFTFLLRGGQDFVLIKFVKWMAIEHSSYRMALLLITRVLFIRRVIFSTYRIIHFAYFIESCRGKTGEGIATSFKEKPIITFVNLQMSKSWLREELHAVFHYNRILHALIM